MHNLRLLQLNYVHLTGGYNHLSRELRWICWHGFPLKFIPNGFHVENVVAIEMQYSNLRQVWKEIKVLGMLKELNLSHSHYLTKTPNFSRVPNLEKLKLKDCTSLVELHSSIGDLPRLVLLDMRDCKRLKNLPRSISILKSLEILNLSGCSNIEKLPEDIGEIEALIELLADRTALRQLPSSIVRLKNMKKLSLCGCKGSTSSSVVSLFSSLVSPRKSRPASISLLPTSLLGLSSLTYLSLQDCNLSDEAVPKDLGSLSSLWTLDLENNNFCSLPTSITNLSKLRFLNLDCCTKLQSLPELPTDLEGLRATYCISLKSLPNMSRFQKMPHLDLTNCHDLVEIPGVEKLKDSSFIRMEGCNNLVSTCAETLLQLWPKFGSSNGGIFLYGNKIPSWFHNQSMGCSVSFQLPPTLKRKISDLVVCVVHASDAIFGNTKDFCLKPPLCRPKNYDTPIRGQDHMWMKSYEKFLLRGGDQVEIVVSPGEGLNVKKCGIHIYDHNERNTRSAGGELMLFNSASNENAIVDDDDDDDDNGLPPHVSRLGGVVGFSILTFIDGSYRYFEIEIHSKS